MTAEDQAGDWDVDLERANMHALLTGVEPGDAPGSYVAHVPNDWEEIMFGGCVIGQTITAATREAPAETRVHSFHGYFLRPALSGTPLAYTVATVRDGRAFSQRRVTASQNGKDVFEAMCSFTRDTEAATYDMPHSSAMPARGEPDGFGLAGFEAKFLGATEQRGDGTYESTERKWFRLPMDIGDDPHLHAAYFGMASDWTGTGSMPLNMQWEFNGGPPPVASLDHALWFHRPARVTDWHLLDLHSLVNYGGRGLLRLTIRDEQGRVVASAAQELLLR